MTLLKDRAAAGSSGAGRSAAGRPPRARRRNPDLFWAVVFLAPALATIIAFRVWPAVTALMESLYKAPPGGLVEARFVGLGNFADLLANADFRATLLRTLVFNLVINPLQIGIALLLATLLVQRIALRGLWRTLIFIPCTIPIVGSTIAWSAALRPDGPVNALLAAAGIGEQPFLTSPRQALAGIILVASWIGIGYWMLFLIAGLRAIPQQYYEAARLDRAGPVRVFWSITLPLLKRSVLFVLVADTVANFVLFVPIQLLTNGGPESSTTLLMFEAYRTTFGYGSRNQGAAEVVILTAIMLIIVAVQFTLLRSDEGDE